MSAIVVLLERYTNIVSLRTLFIPVMLQTQVLRVRQVNEPCIGLTQENSIENSVQNGLPYILKPYGLC